MASNLCSHPGPAMRPPSCPTAIVTKPRGSEIQVPPSSSAPAVDRGSIAKSVAAKKSVVFVSICLHEAVAHSVSLKILNLLLPSRKANRQFE